MSVNLTLPLPPSSNNAYKNLRGKGRVLTAEGKAYKITAAMLAIGQGARLIAEGDVAIVGTVYLDSRRRDLSNCIKLMEDALKGVCYADDRQVSHLDLRRRFDRGNPRIEIHVALDADQRAAA